MRLFILHFILFFCCDVFAQDSTVIKKPVDSLSIPSTVVVKKDSAKPVLQMPVKASFDSARNHVLKNMVKLKLYANPEFFIEKEKQSRQKDWLFYYILGLSLFFGLLRLSYQRYFKDLFRVFFRTSLRVNQIREQLVQSGLQSLLFNIFFAASAGTYVYLLLSFFKVSVQLPELLIPLIAALIIAVLYLGKYLFLQFSGWLFTMRNPAETYSFIVFLINKILGILILPFIVVIAFASDKLAAIAITISLALITGMFLYRFLRAYGPVQADLKLARFHFFIFFLAFEIAPLLLIYKVSLRFL